MNNKFLCVWTGYVSQYFVIFNFYILLYTQGNLIKNLAIFCAIITIWLFNVNTQQCGSINNFTDIGIGEDLCNWKLYFSVLCVKYHTHYTNKSSHLSF